MGWKDELEKETMFPVGPVDGYSTTEQVAERLGLSYAQARRHLSDAYKAGKCKRMTVRIGGRRVNVYED